jgi:triphosphoribosyl-dephospho-CoA synthase
VGGAKGEAQAGFPTVLRRGLPALSRCGSSGPVASNRVNALLSIMTCLDDSCLLGRGGRSGLHLAQAGASYVLQVGGAGTATGQRALHHLDHALVRRRLSPGGAADLLAATLFLHSIGSVEPSQCRVHRPELSFRSAREC